MTATIATQATKDAVLAVLRASEHPLDVAQVRQRLRNDYGLEVARATVSAALRRLMQGSLAAYEVGEDGRTQSWRAVPPEAM